MAAAAPCPPAPAGSPSPGRLRRFRLASEGWPFVLVPLGLALVILLLPGHFRWLAIPFALGGTFSAWFFRDPDRPIPPDPQLVLAPADGKVTEAVAESHSVRITVFLNVFNVHVNRAPMSGRVQSVQHHPGRFLAAFRPEAPLVNERNDLVLETTRGPVRVLQVAGLIARRIVCRVRPGDHLLAGDRFGMIRFGSCTQLILPGGAVLLVKPGDRVRGGSTPLARWPKEGP